VGRSAEGRPPEPVRLRRPAESLWGAEVRVARENKSGEVRFEDDEGKKMRACLQCRHMYDGETCPSDLCVVRFVLES
jgi:hypothetical protein